MEARVARSSSSSSLRPDLIRPDLNDDDDDERVLRLLPPEFRPAWWCHRYRSQEEVIAALDREPLSIALPDALDLLQRYGLAACEGALLRTMSHLRSNGKKISKPGGLFVASLSKGWAWSPDGVAAFVSREREKCLEAAERSDNVTVQRLAREIRAPENVVPLERRAE